MNTFDAIAKRASVRKYQNKAISKKDLERLIDAGHRAPTARKVEPWEFIVVTDKIMLQKLSELAVNGSFIKEAAAGILIFCHETKYYLEDGCAATENILLAAADMGLGACWIAGDKKPYGLQMGQMLGVPEECNLVSIIALGWPDAEPAQVRHRGLAQVLHWERF